MKMNNGFFAGFLILTSAAAISPLLMLLCK